MADKSYALVKDGIVFNTIVWDGESEIDFGSGVTTVEITDGKSASIGYLCDGENFTAPELTDDEKTAALDEIKQSNTNTKSYLMDEANNKVSVLQDAVDLDMATDAETTALPLWKKYRVLLSRVDANTAENITWPEKPS